MTLYDAYGQKVDTGRLTEEVAAATLTGIRNPWTESVASGLTPARLSAMLRGAAAGDMNAYLTLAEEIEEIELHYLSVLGTRKRAVSGLEVTVEAATDDAADVKLADAVRELVAESDFVFVVEDLLDALGKGFSVIELLWDRSGREWRPRFEWRDPRWFCFDQRSGRELRLLDPAGGIDGLELPPYKFLRHVHRLKTGIPIRGGLARSAAWSFCFKSYTLKDWMAFLEVYGMPLRLGKYGSGASPADIAVLKRAVANLGTDAAAVVPESMKVEFIEAMKSGATDAFERFAQFLDKQVSKAVLGQTATTEGTPGQLGNQDAQGDVRRDLLKSDALQVPATLNRDLVRPYVDLNFGPPASGRYPRLCLPVPDPEDLKTLTQALKDLVPLGLKVEQSVIRDKLRLPDPAEDAELLQAPAAAPPPPIPPALNRALNSAAAPAPAEGAPSMGPAGLPPPGADTPDRQTERLAAEAGPSVDVWIEKIRAAMDEAQSLPELQQKIEQAFPELDAADLTKCLAEAMAAAALAGRYELLTGA